MFIIIFIDMFLIVILLILRSFFSRWLAEEYIEEITLKKTFYINLAWLFLMIVFNGLIFVILLFFNSEFSPLRPLLSLILLIIEFFAGFIIITYGLKLSFWNRFIHTTIILVTSRFLIFTFYALFMLLFDVNVYGIGLYIFILV